MSRISAAVALVLCLSACESTLLNHNGIVRPSPSTTYREGERQVANVGDLMTSTVQFSVLKAVGTSRDFVGTTTHKGRDWKFTAPAGTYVLAGESPEGAFYLSKQGLKSNTREAWGGFFVPNDTSAAIEIAFTWVPWSRYGSQSFRLYAAPADEPVQLRELAPVLEPVHADFVATLSYAGVSSGQIKFVYKEFTVRSGVFGEEMFARPAFTQEVSLDYKPGETYGYKNARVIVHDAGSTQVTYTLMSHL